MIYQPVINNTNEYEISVDELLAFEKDVVEPAVKAIKSGDKTARENSKCKYCPGLAYCKKKLDSARKLVDLNRKIETLTEEEITEILPKCDDYIAYFEKVKEHCLKRAMNGHKYPGFKLVRSRVTRKITKLTLPASLRYIGKNSFKQLTSIKKFFRVFFGVY